MHLNVVNWLSRLTVPGQGEAEGVEGVRGQVVLTLWLGMAMECGQECCKVLVVNIAGTTTTKMAKL